MATRKLICPSCDAGLKVADDLAGTKIRCPKCDSSFRVPENEDEGVAEDRPVKPRSAKKKKPASSLPLVLGLVIGALVLVGGGAAAAWAWWPAKKPSGGGAATGASGGSEKAGGGGGEQTSTGRDIYDRNGCARCHQIDAAPSMGAGKGGRPVDLRTVGAKRSREYIEAHIRDAKSHQPKSRMPAFPEEKLSSSDLKVLSEYLAGLK